MKRDPGIVLGTTPAGGPQEVPLSAFETHCQCLGATGSGKSRGLEQIAHEVVLKATDHAFVFVDPKGDAYHRMLRWCLQQNLDDRLVLINPAESRLVAGFNPLQFSGRNLEAEALVAAELVLRSLGISDPMERPQVFEWSLNLIYALAASELTFAEAPLFLNFSDSSFRRSVIRNLPDSTARDGWLWLTEHLDSATSFRAKQMLYEVLGPILRRFRFYTAHETLRLMLGSPISIRWDQVLDDHKIVLVNLQRMPGFGNLDRRLFGLQIISGLLQETFRRREHERAPLFLVVDEAQHFVSPEIQEILEQGRSYGVSLVMAHQSMEQLIDHRTQDRTLYELVSGCTRMKIVYPLTGPLDAQIMGETLYGPYLDPYRVKQEIWSLQQLSGLVDSESYTDGSARGSSVTNTHGESAGEAHHQGTSSSSGSTTSSGSGAGESFAVDPNGNMIRTAQNSSASASTGTFQQSGVQEGSTTSSQWNSSLSRGASHTVSNAITRGKMVAPVLTYRQLTSRTYLDLAEQLHLEVSKIRRKKTREAIIAWPGQPPIEFTSAHVGEFSIDGELADFLVYDLMRSQPHAYARPEAISQALAARYRRVIAASNPDPTPLLRGDPILETQELDPFT